MNKKITFRSLILVVILVSVYFLNAQGEEGKIFLDEFANDNTKARFVIETEYYSGVTPADFGSWWEVDGKTNKFNEGPDAGELAPTAKSGARGNYMEFIFTKKGKGRAKLVPTGMGYPGSFLDYKISVETAGRYRLYLRWTGRDTSSDSIYAFILKPDGTLLTSGGSDYPDFFMYHSRTDWTWDNIGLKNVIDTGIGSRDADAVWMVPEPGIYTIRLASREKETAVDVLVFQTDNLPAPTE